MVYHAPVVLNDVRLLLKLILAIVLTCILAACASPAPTDSPTQPALPSLTAEPPTATAQPASSLALDGLPQTVSPFGFPQIGYENAPISVGMFLAFDDPDSAAVFAQSFPTLIERAHGGEILITTVPLLNNAGAADARGAARAALCAGEQNEFYAYAGQVFEWLSQFGIEGLAGSRLIEGINSLALNRGAWDECMISGRPDAVLEEAARLWENLTYNDATPVITVNEVSSPFDPESLNFTIDRQLAEFNANLDTLLEATPEVTEIIVPIDPLTGDRVQPPLLIGLPEGWATGYETLLLQDLDAIRTVPFAVYTGPVTGGTGTIILLWAFPNVIAATDSPNAQTDLWLDGLRLLRLAVVEAGCNIGTDLRDESLTIGGLAAVGTTFAAVDCPDNLPDIRGWFAGLRQYGLNYVFYMFTDPIDAMDTAQDELQAILDTVQFIAPPSPSPTPPIVQEMTTEATP